MQNIAIKNIGNVAVFDEFHDIYRTAKSIDVCDTKTRPSEIFEKIRQNRAVVFSGDYDRAEAILWYIHHYEDKLAAADDQDYYESFGMSPNHAAIQRFKVHRLSYLLKENKMPLLRGGGEENISDWLPEDVSGQFYLLPARRHERILTDMQRASEGIFFDCIGSAIHIAPFVYVPFDKSVPEMFLAFGDYIKGKKVIDVGTGTGILAILAVRLGAKSVTASDINPKAVSCARENFARSDLGCALSDVVCSDLFDAIQGEFDTVIFNAPRIQGEPKNIYEAAIYDPGYKVISDFFGQAKAHLSENGTILLQYSDISQANGDGSMDNLGRLLDLHNMRIADSKSILRKNRLAGAMERVYVFAIKNIRRG